MRLLLDSHAFLWYIESNSRLSRRALDAIIDPANDVFLSVASHWEIALKIRKGKLTLQAEWPEIVHREIAANAFSWLAIKPEHCEATMLLPENHGDPFDRMLVAQAQVEKLAIVTVDANMAAYDVPIIW